MINNNYEPFLVELSPPLPSVILVSAIFHHFQSTAPAPILSQHMTGRQVTEQEFPPCPPPYPSFTASQRRRLSSHMGFSVFLSSGMDPILSCFFRDPIPSNILLPLVQLPTGPSPGLFSHSPLSLDNLIHVYKSSYHLKLMTRRLLTADWSWTLSPLDLHSYIHLPIRELLGCPIICN